MSAPGESGTDVVSAAVRAAEEISYDTGAGVRIAALGGTAEHPIPDVVWQSLRPDASGRPVRSELAGSVGGADFFIATTTAGLVCLDYYVPALSRGVDVVGGAGCAPPESALSAGVFVYSSDLNLAVVLVPDGYAATVTRGQQEFAGRNVVIVRGDGSTLVLTRDIDLPSEGTPPSVVVRIPPLNPGSGTQVTMTRTVG